MRQNDLDQELLDKIKKMIVTSTGMSIDAINKQIDEKIASLNGLLTPIGAALVLADKLRVKIDFDGPPEGGAEAGSDFISIKELGDGMTNINVAGRVSNVYPSKDFTRKKDGKPGKVGAVVIKDATGTIRVTLWNQMTGVLPTIHDGDIIGIYNAFVKAGYQGGVEIGTSIRTNIKINPEGIDASRLPADTSAPSSIPTSIKDVTGARGSCTIVAKVAVKMEPKMFQKKDGTDGTIGKVIVNDDSGSATVIFWKERMKDYDELNVGSVYEFSNLGVKFNTFRNEIEFNVNKNTRIVNPASKTAGT